MKTVLHVVGARPNFMKVAPIHRQLKRRGVAQLLVHTGQHYDLRMSEVFFEQLALPSPDAHLGVGSGSHAAQTAKTMLELERVLTEARPSLVSVVGDVNSTLAAALVCSKLCLPLAHVEAGLRSFDRAMPEEINRVVTDRLADLLLTPSPDGDANLLAEGVEARRVFRVGNVMIDTLLAAKEHAQALPTLEELSVSRGNFAVCTLHRPSNVDEPEVFRELFETLCELSKRLPVVFPVHPRTRGAIKELGIEELLPAFPTFHLCEPLGYLEFLCLTSQAKLVLTDSGGLQEESTALGVPCLTLRENTERPITVSEGTNVVVGTSRPRIEAEVTAILEGRGKKGRVPELWDGHAAERVADVYERFLS